jgi:hypothetical protein
LPLVSWLKYLYNQSMNAAVVRRLLVFSLIALYLLAVLSLRRRALSLKAYAAWGLFALLLPALGPFLVLLFRPGKPLPRTIPRR